MSSFFIYNFYCRTLSPSLFFLLLLFLIPSNFLHNHLLPYATSLGVFICVREEVAVVFLLQTHVLSRFTEEAMLVNWWSLWSRIQPRNGLALCSHGNPWLQDIWNSWKEHYQSSPCWSLRDWLFFLLGMHHWFYHKKILNCSQNWVKIDKNDFLDRIV